jgi:hypothetical protein
MSCYNEVNIPESSFGGTVNEKPTPETFAAYRVNAAREDARIKQEPEVRRLLKTALHFCYEAAPMARRDNNLDLNTQVGKVAYAAEQISQKLQDKELIPAEEIEALKAFLKG